jgi:hypothetical protein
MDLEKAGSKKQGHFYSKREEAAWPLLFLNNNDCFLHPAFFRSIFGPEKFLESIFYGGKTSFLGLKI